MMNALIGGALIGFAVSIMLVFNGRITGISGILGGMLSPNKGDISWRVMFFVGLLSGGLFLSLFSPERFSLDPRVTSFDYALAGFLVGFGTLLGNGCTSGHGVCGISRLSIRSILATMTFIGFGILSVLLFNSVRG